MPQEIGNLGTHYQRANGQADGQMDGRTFPHIEMHGDALRCI